MTLPAAIKEGWISIVFEFHVSGLTLRALRLSPESFDSRFTTKSWTNAEAARRKTSN
jgi:hypothetical protein